MEKKNQGIKQTFESKQSPLKFRAQTLALSYFLFSSVCVVLTWTKSPSFFLASFFLK